MRESQALGPVLTPGHLPPSPIFLKQSPIFFQNSFHPLNTVFITGYFYFSPLWHNNSSLHTSVSLSLPLLLPRFKCLWPTFKHTSQPADDVLWRAALRLATGTRIALPSNLHLGIVGQGENVLVEPALGIGIEFGTLMKPLKYGFFVSLLFSSISFRLLIAC